MKKMISVKMSHHRHSPLVKRISRVFCQTCEYALEKVCAVIPDRVFVTFQYRKVMGRFPNLKNPVRLSEKMTWLKLYDRRPEYISLVDKMAVKGIVADRIGEEHVIPMLGCWSSAEEIDFPSLPEQFVLKCTHDSGSALIVRNKAEINKKQLLADLRRNLRRNYYYHAREWQYKNVIPRIIAEPYIPSLANKESLEYKLTCFNGRVELITVCCGIAHSNLDARTNDFFDRDFNPLHFRCYYKNSVNPPVRQKPDFMDEMIQYAERLSDNIPVVRVDFYFVNGTVFFGEMTLYTWAAYTKFDPENVDLFLGQKLCLPDMTSQRL